MFSVSFRLPSVGCVSFYYGDRVNLVFANSSGTGSLPNVITVNIIDVQMNVNSSTIIVQVDYCMYTVTQHAPTLSLSRV